MDHELHAARFIKEALQHDRLVRRQATEGRGSRREIVDDLLGGRKRDSDFLGQPMSTGAPGRIRLQSRRHVCAKARHSGRELIGPARRLAEPERNCWWLSVGVFDPDGPAFHPLNPIGPVAELEYVTRHALDREVFIHGADHAVFGLKYHPVVGGIRNGAARGQRGRARAAAGPQDMVDTVAMNQRTIAASARRETLSQHTDDGVEVIACQLAEGPCAPQPIVECRFVPISSRNLGRDLLRQHVERSVRDYKPIEFPATKAFSWPRLSLCSAESRCSFAILPWCAVIESSAIRPDNSWATRSAMRRVLKNTRVVRCDLI